MFLEYGVDDNGALVRIDGVGRGRTGLKCPYCGGPLLAKKGEIKAPHFAHEGDTCAASVSGNASLPAYDSFELHIPGKVLNDLRRFASDDDYGVRTWKLKEYDLIEVNYQGNFELTKKGKIPLGQLSLGLFSEYQDAALLEKHERLEAAARQAHKGAAADPSTMPDYLMRLTDLRLYRAQWRRLLQSTLYFIEVNHTSKEWGVPFYKIGVSTRDMSARLAEIEKDLAPHLGPVTLKVLDTWPYRGGIEPYFKHRYQKNQRKLGTLTEYFLFNAEALKKALSYDLRRMPKKTLTPFERELYRGGLSAFEQDLEAAAIEARRRARVSEGMRKAQARGRTIGRPKDESAAAFLGKASSLAVIEALNAGASIREAARITGISVPTVQKVKNALRDTAQGAQAAEALTDE